MVKKEKGEPKEKKEVQKEQYSNYLYVEQLGFSIVKFCLLQSQK